MGTQQGTVVYIDDNNKSEAEFMSHNFLSKEDKNRAYVNVLGAEALMNYFAVEKIDMGEFNNIHSISRVLGAIDIADIMLPNIYIDVRVVFDENQIFIPKSHSEFGIEPDVYVVMKIAENLESFEILGYFEPDIIDKNLQNDKYYFIQRDKLTSPFSLISYIRNFKKTGIIPLSQIEMEKGFELSIALADHDISYDDLKKFLSLLVRSEKLRDEILEFDNFETLSHSAASYLNAVGDESQDEDSDVEVSAVAYDTGTETKFEDVQEDFSDDPDISDDSADLLEDAEDVAPESEEEITIEEDDSVKMAENESELENDSNENPMKMEIPANLLDEVLDNNLTNQYRNVDAKDRDKNGYGVEMPTNIDGGILVPDNDVFNNSSLIPDNLTTNIEDLKQVAPDDTYIDIVMQQENSTFNLEDLPASDNFPVHTHDDVGMNLEDLPQTETYIPEHVEVTANIEDLPQAEGEVFVNEFDTATNIEDLPQAEGEVYEEDINNLLGDLSEVDTIISNSSQVTSVTENLSTEETLSEDSFPFDDLTEEATDEEKSVTEENAEETLSEDSFPFDDLTEEATDEEKPVTEENSEETLSEDSFPFDDLTEEATGEEKPVTEENSEETLSEDSFPVEELTEESSGEDTLLTDELTEESLNEEQLSIDELTEEPLSEENLSVEDLPVEELEMGAFVVDDLPEDTITEETTPVVDDNKPLSSESAEQELSVEEFTKEDFQTEELSLEDLVTDEDSNQDAFTEIVEAPTDIMHTDTQVKELDVNILNAIENKQNESDFFSFGEDNDEHQDDAFDLAGGDDTWENTDDFTNAFNESDIVENTANELNNSDISYSFDDFNTFNAAMGEPESANYDVESNLSSMDQIRENGVSYNAEANENSAAISDSSFQPGEILIDINNDGSASPQTPGELENLYNKSEDLQDGTMLNSQARFSKSANNGKGGSGATLVIGGLITIGLLVVVSMAALKFIKPAEQPQTATSEGPIIQDNENPVPSVGDENVVSMDDNNIPSVPEPEVASPVPQEPTPAPETLNPEPVKVSGTASTRKMNPTSFISVSKLTWEVPDYISYNNEFKSYFRSSGKSLKSSLSSDLLLATDLVYSKQVRVSVTFDQSGTFKESRIVMSSGSSQIDNIVLQSVNQTLKVLKAPGSVGNDQSTTAILKIYF